MKKIAKISLVAAIAVAGFTTANAQPLEEAIKNVDVTGSVVYRYNDVSNDGSNNGVPVTTNKSASNNNYKVALNLSSKVNEDVKFNSRFLVANPDGNFAGPLDTQVAGDSNVNTTLSHANFAYTGVKNTTVLVGKQGLTTPWTVALDSDGQEQTGTGILALSAIGPVTLGGGYFNQTNLGASGDVLPGLNSSTTTAGATLPVAGGAGTVTLPNTVRSNDDFGDRDVAALAAIAALGPVTADVWYLDMQDIFDTFTVGAKSTPEFAGIKFALEARHTDLDMDGSTTDNSLTKFVVSGDAGLIDAKLAYAMTDKEGGLVSLDNDAATNLLGWSLSANNKRDADYIQAVVGVDILSNLNLSANYGNIEWTPAANTTREQEELYAQLLYKMSKNLSTYVRYGTFTDETTTAGVTNEANDDIRGRLQVEYTF